MASDFIKWNDSLSVKHDTIDEQHKKLIELLNRLYTAFMEKKHIEALAGIVNELVEYTEYHFGTEEAMFEKYSYEQAAAHKAEHEGFVKTIKEFAADLERNPGSLTYKLMTFLKKWICEHIQGSDKKYISMYS